MEVPAGIRSCFMKRRENGFGFVLCCENDTTDTYVLHVLDDSSAGDAGLVPGDKIIRINGINVELESHSDVVQRLQGISALDLQVEHDAKACDYFTKPKNGMTVLPLKEKPKQPHPKIISVKKAKRGYGFIVETVGKSRKNMDPKYRQALKGAKGHYIQAVDDMTDAYKFGLRADDRVIEINGVNVEMESHAYIIHAIKHSPKGKLELYVVDRRADEYYAKIGRAPSRDDAIKNDQPRLDENQIIDCSTFSDKNEQEVKHQHHNHEMSPEVGKPQNHSTPNQTSLNRHASDVGKLSSELNMRFAKRKHPSKLSSQSFNDSNHRGRIRTVHNNNNNTGEFDMDLQTLMSRVKLSNSPKPKESLDRRGYKNAYHAVNK